MVDPQPNYQAAANHWRYLKRKSHFFCFFKTYFNIENDAKKAWFCTSDANQSFLLSHLKLRWTIGWLPLPLHYSQGTTSEAFGDNFFVQTNSLEELCSLPQNCHLPGAKAVMKWWNDEWSSFHAFFMLRPVMSLLRMSILNTTRTDRPRMDDSHSKLVFGGPPRSEAL